MKSGGPKSGALAIVLCAGAIYAYGAYLLGSVRTPTARLQRDLERSEEQIRWAQAELRNLRAKEEDPTRREELDARAQALLGTIQATYRVTTPAIFSEVLEGRGLHRSSSRLSLLLPHRVLPGRAIAQWSVSVPDVDTIALGEALADLENRFPLGRLNECVLQSREGGGGVAASMTFDTVVDP
jgi:hypothetical protein